MTKLAFVFPGQASQYIGMAQDLYEAYQEVRELFDRADDILGFNLKTKCFEGPTESLMQTDVTQPAVFVHSIAVLQLLLSEDIKPSMVAGHSLGEYSALVAAGAVSFEEALTLVAERSRSMLTAGNVRRGSMSAIIGLDDNRIINLCEQVSDVGLVVAANFNAPGQVVISGECEAVDYFGELARKDGAKRVMALPVSGAFHSPLMQDATDYMLPLIDAANFRKPEIPVITNVSAVPLVEMDLLRRDLIAQITHPVRWTESMEILMASGVDVVVEVGPGQVLKGLMRRINRKVQMISVGTLEEISNAITELKGGEI